MKHTSYNEAISPNNTTPYEPVEPIFFQNIAVGIKVLEYEHRQTDRPMQMCMHT